MYKLMINPITSQLDKVMLTTNSGVLIFGLDNPQSSAYQTFKQQISEETAQLQDAEGTLMTAQAAKDFIKELP